MSFLSLVRRMFQRAAEPRNTGLRHTRLNVTPLEDRVNPVGTVSVAALTHAVENNTAGVFRFTGSGFSGSQNVSFFYSGTGTATPGIDFDSSQTSVSVGNGTTDVTISTYNDPNVEGTEDIILVIIASKAYNGGGSSATINLYDDDTVQVTVAKQGGDPTEGGNGAFRITRSGSTSGNLTVNFTVGGTAASGTDFTSIGTSATITSGNSYVDVTVPTLADNVVESGGETVAITITDGGSTYTAIPSATANMTITDDPPVVSIEATDTVEGANGKFRISRTGGKISDSLTVYYSVTGGSADSGDDFTALSGSVVIGGGNSYADVTVAALADNLIEGDEDLEVTITSGSYTISGGTDTLIITDDPPVVSVARYEDGEEGGTDGTFRVSRTGGDISEALVVTYTVGGTAVGPSDVDYVELSGTVTIPSSAAYADITIDVTNDGSSEGTETVTITLDTDEDWLNGSASDTLFIWDNEGTFVYWTGAEDDSWMNADNWSGNAVPDGDDIVIFNGTYVDDVTLSGPLSPYSIGELRIESSYTGKITLSFPLSVGGLKMEGGTIDQPYSAYGSDLTVTGASLWVGGVLNSTANLASVIFNAAVVSINGTLATGSDLVFVDADGVINADIDCANAPTLVSSGTSVIMAGGGAAGFHGDVKVDGGLYTLGTDWTINSLYVLNGGTATLVAPAVMTVSGAVPGFIGVAVLVDGGDLNLQNTSKLNAGSNLVMIEGSAGKNARAANLNTFGAPGMISGGREEATITASKLMLGSAGGDTTVTLGRDDMNPMPALGHRFSKLTINGPVDWIKGKYVPTLSTDVNIRDRWESSGTFKIEGAATSVAPTGTTVLGSEGMIILASTISPNDGKSTTLPSVTTANWDWDSGTTYGAAFWTVKVVT